MATEVERKFILDSVPDALPEGRSLRQGYLAEEDDVEVRVRIDGESAVLTVKAGRGLSRTEVEKALTIAEANSLWPHTAGRRVEKVRHRMRHGAGLVLEVDLYGGALDGLRVVEVEFPDEQASSAFEAPEWFGRELTGDARWSNAALARHGRPD